jgi:hypothetical protein
MSSSPLTAIIEALQVPSAYSRYEDTSPEIRVGLDKWREDSCSLLKELLVLVQDQGQLDKAQSAGLICAVAPLAIDFSYSERLIDGPRYQEEENVLKRECPWIHLPAQTFAQGASLHIKPYPSLTNSIEILQLLESKDQELWTYVLENNVKPIFIASNPHPHLNPQTGRSLPQSQVLRPPQQGGFSSVTQDFFVPEGQRWKAWVGLGAVLYWCVAHFEVCRSFVRPSLCSYSPRKAHTKQHGIWLSLRL